MRPSKRFLTLFFKSKLFTLYFLFCGRIDGFNSFRSSKCGDVCIQRLEIIFFMKNFLTKIFFPHEKFVTYNANLCKCTARTTACCATIFGKGSLENKDQYKNIRSHDLPGYHFDSWPIHDFLQFGKRRDMVQNMSVDEQLSLFLHQVVELEDSHSRHCYLKVEQLKV